MSYSCGTLVADSVNTDRDGHYRFALTSDHHDESDTRYDQVDVSRWKMWHLESYFRDDEPGGPYGTNTYAENVYYYLFPEDTNSRFDHFDPNEDDSSYTISYGASVGATFGLGWVSGGASLGVSSSYDQLSITQDYDDHRYAIRYRAGVSQFNTDSSDEPDDMWGLTFDIETRGWEDNDYEVVAESEVGYTYVDPGGWMGFSRTSTLGGTATYTAVDN